MKSEAERQQQLCCVNRVHKWLLLVRVRKNERGKEEKRKLKYIKSLNKRLRALEIYL